MFLNSNAFNTTFIFYNSHTVNINRELHYQRMLFFIFMFHSYLFICYNFIFGQILFVFYAEENLVTALVPSLTACLASSPGNINRTAVCISRLLNVAFLL
jgi:hypothetical protein